MTSLGGSQFEPSPDISRGLVRDGPQNLEMALKSCYDDLRNLIQNLGVRDHFWRHEIFDLYKDNGPCFQESQREDSLDSCLDACLIQKAPPTQQNLRQKLQDTEKYFWGLTQGFFTQLTGPLFAFRFSVVDMVKVFGNIPQIRNLD